MTALPRSSRRWRWLVAVALLALAVRAAALAAVEARNPASMMSPDSHGYRQLARTLLHSGRFAAAADAPAHTRSTPLFPAWVAAVYAVAGDSARAVVRLNVLLGALTVVVAALAAHRLGGAAAGAAAGVLLSLDTASLAAGLRMLTETPFAFWLTAAVAMTLSCARSPAPGPGRCAAAGALLATAALTRHVGLFLIVPVAAWFLVCARRLGWRREATVRGLAALLLPWLLLVGGWQLRNQRAAGTWAPSDSPAKFLLLSRGGDIVAQREGIPFAEARARLAAAIAEEHRRTGVREGSLYLPAALDLVARHPLAFLWTQVRWLPEMLLGTGAAPLAGSLGLEGGEGTRPAAVAAVLRLASAAHLALFYLAVAWAAGTAWGGGEEASERRLALGLLLGLSAGFVLLSTGPQTYSRLRAPFMPLLAIAAGLGVQARRRPRRAPAAPP